ncbi:mannose-1-phosphate guanylyltransferase/mannose-6-phosphate isomerase [Solimonas marina]|uniref:mannose-1-phosphate guanylyltransferase n=1 Tax=Solimonas marina TaxID=2714601 RepID=A0A970B647_9GAMM|nr:mannose-1-phosphate guanylyltransferase/mannose-6-phosphate isomerase [Solimonas marina]NKF22418.1 mannose-1-phosphate guanylyltransferase/mannose-6-phosphate isomerase [Solimonas marina]
MTQARLVVPVLMAGGSGTRLWPLSREQHPKQFLSLLGNASLFQDTALRTAKIDEAVGPVVIGAAAHRFVIAEQLRQAKIRDAAMLLEPEGRNTAPAAAVAAHFVAEEFGPDAIVFLMAADHAIDDQAAFERAVQSAVDAATQGYIVTFGIKPTRPETGFGYLKVKSGARLGTTQAYEVDSFVEKPTIDRAQQFIEQGDHFWNGGMFLFRSGRFLAELRRLEPETYMKSYEALQKAKREGDTIALDARAWRECRNESIDYAVMEKTDQLALVPLDAGWDDVGSWNFLERLPTSDGSNRTRGDVMLEDSNNNLVHSSGRLVAMVGVSDHVVVETEDAVLVAPKDRVQDVKKIVQKLKRSQRTEAEAHRRCYRPWGFYETVALGERFQVKRISVKPGEKLSLQMHFHRAEHWVVVRGTARVTCGDNTFIVSEDQSTYIPLGNTHRLENPGKVPLELIEVQTGCYVGEDDIVRFSDSYGRSEQADAPTSQPALVKV